MTIRAIATPCVDCLGFGRRLPALADSGTLRSKASSLDVQLRTCQTRVGLVGGTSRRPRVDGQDQPDNPSVPAKSAIEKDSATVSPRSGHGTDATRGATAN
jgi:hypothetical protein